MKYIVTEDDLGGAGDICVPFTYPPRCHDVKP